MPPCPEHRTATVKTVSSMIYQPSTDGDVQNLHFVHCIICMACVKYQLSKRVVDFTAVHKYSFFVRLICQTFKWTFGSKRQTSFKRLNCGRLASEARARAVMLGGRRIRIAARRGRRAALRRCFHDNTTSRWTP